VPKRPFGGPVGSTIYHAFLLFAVVVVGLFGTLASLKWKVVAVCWTRRNLTRRSLTRRSLAKKRAVVPWLLFGFFVFFYCSSKYTPDRKSVV
jgi:hypothetical protein